MKKLREHQKTLLQVEDLVKQMKAELNQMRYLLYRYYLKHGPEVENGEVKLADDIFFDVKGERDKAFVLLSTYKDTGVLSRYEEILAATKELEG